MTREDDPLKQTPAAELDRDNRAMTREPEDVASVGTLLVERELRAEVERLKEQLASLRASSGYEASIAQAEIERLRAALLVAQQWMPLTPIDDEAKREVAQIRVALGQAILEPKP